MITVHYLQHSRAHRILWLLEELGIDYQIRTYRRGADFRGPSELKAVHPLGKSPVIEDDGRIYAESGAIIDYLIDTYGGAGLKPEAGSEAYTRYRYWLHYAEGSAMPVLFLKIVIARMPRQVPWLLRPLARMISKAMVNGFIDPQVVDHLTFWESELSKDGFFTGSTLTGADIAMSFPVEAAMTELPKSFAIPAIRRYLDAIRARPAYKRALERGAYIFASS
ncbi:glutathione S-transferase family protein [Rhizobium paknamense]|uniref:Glutathione S-transferase n=1 Tax=Rhizobium paknamense TaxID=1206817 RepID=A0ABU0I8I5_9HYPH|nr:glutathione S-transferase [Rhizobium paknamense]MDQ0454547.1 glutathione S-transferase [Rhizobium paknamense]